MAAPSQKTNPTARKRKAKASKEPSDIDLGATAPLRKKGKVASQETLENTTPQGQDEKVPEAVEADQKSNEAPVAAAMPKDAFLSEETFMRMHEEEKTLSKLTVRVVCGMLGFDQLTWIQSKALPIALRGKDVLAQAETGSGKTLAFVIPIFERLLSDPPEKGKCHSLVLCPTRELVVQTETVMNRFLKLTPQYHCHRFVGGLDVDCDRDDLAQGHHIDVIISTPGRLSESMGLGEVIPKRFDSVKILVIDEVDRLVDAGFKRRLFHVLSKLPNVSQRQTLLFSATTGPRVEALTKNLTHPGCTKVGNKRLPTTIDQMVMFLPSAMELVPVLYSVLITEQKKPNHKILVFFQTNRMTRCMYLLFGHMNGINPMEMHAAKGQAYRQTIYEVFSKRKQALMFTSDVCSRGLDYPDVTCVIQVGSPVSTRQYIHRVGRTARAGREGRSISILFEFERGLFEWFKSLPGLREFSCPSAPEFPPNEQNPIDYARSRVALSPSEAHTLVFDSFVSYYLSLSKGAVAIPISKLISDAMHLFQWIFCMEGFPILPEKTIRRFNLEYLMYDVKTPENEQLRNELGMRPLSRSQIKKREAQRQKSFKRVRRRARADEKENWNQHRSNKLF